MAKTWSIKDAGLMIDTIEKDAKAAVSRGLLSAAHRSVALILGEIIPGLANPPVDKGIYRAGWRARKDGDGAIVENVTPEAVLIEEGVRGSNVKIGRKMIDALTEWVKRHRLGGKMVTGRSGKKHHVAASDSEARSIAFAIAKSMQKRGIFGQKGLGVLRTASKRFPEFIHDEVLRELKRV